MNKIFKTFISFFFPERCPYCLKRIDCGKIACDECSEQLPETYNMNYAKGGYPCCSPFFYQGIFADGIKYFKFRGYLQSSEKIAVILCECIKKYYDVSTIDFVTFVPMHKKKLSDRGYNQSELLAKDVSKKLGIPFRALLIKHKENMDQHKCLSSAKRRENVKGVYKAVEDETIKGKTILIIDDILTTGYTLGECAKTLEKYTNSKILCATVCAKNDIYT